MRFLCMTFYLKKLSSLLNGTFSNIENVIGLYECLINNSAYKVFAELKNMFTHANRSDDKLNEIIMHFAAEQTEVYFEAGVIIGFQLCENLDKDCKN